MTMQQASPAPGRTMRLIGYGLGAVLLATLGWEIIAESTATMQASSRPEAALSWRSKDSRALVELAERRFVDAESPEERAEAQQLATAALAANPLEARALRMLGLIAEKDGDRQRAVTAMERAAERTLRDPLVHGWMFEQRLREGRYGDALTHVDVLLRTQPHLREDILPALMSLAVDERAAPAMVAMFASDTPWRAWFLRAFAANAQDPVAPTALFTALAAGPNPPTDVELRPHIERLITAGMVDRAFLVWLGHLPRDRRTNVPYLYNGDFRYPVSNLPFDWVITPTRGATIEQAQLAGTEARSLRVEFVRGRVPFRHVTKLLLLPPGNYSLSGRGRSEDLRNARGMQWRLFCADAEQTTIKETPRLSGTSDGWVGFDEPFTIPATGCAAQWLRLELAARIATEEQVEGGTVWYRGLRILRTDREAQRAEPASAPAATPP